MLVIRTRTVTDKGFIGIELCGVSTEPENNLRVNLIIDSQGLVFYWNSTGTQVNSDDPVL